MTDTATRQISPGLKLSALGPHRVSGGAYYALSQSMPNRVTLVYSSAEPKKLTFEFGYQGTDSSSKVPVRVGDIGEGLVASLTADPERMRPLSIELVGWSLKRWGNEDIGAGRSLDRLLATVATKTHLEKALIISSIAAIELLQTVALPMVRELKSHEDPR